MMSGESLEKNDRVWGECNKVEETWQDLFWIPEALHLQKEGRRAPFMWGSHVQPEGKVRKSFLDSMTCFWRNMPKCHILGNHVLNSITDCLLDTGFTSALRKFICILCPAIWWEQIPFQMQSVFFLSIGLAVLHCIFSGLNWNTSRLSSSCWEHMRFLNWSYLSPFSLGLR